MSIHTNENIISDNIDIYSEIKKCAKLWAHYRSTKKIIIEYNNDKIEEIFNGVYEDNDLKNLKYYMRLEFEYEINKIINKEIRKIIKYVGSL